MDTNVQHNDSMSKLTVNRKLKSVLVFSIWPLGGFLVALHNSFRSRIDRIVLWLFSGFVGICISLTLETSDFKHYILDFQESREMNFSGFFQSIIDFFTLNSELTDLGNHTIYFMLSRFTTDPQILLLSLGLFYGFFYSGVINQIASFTRKKGLLSMVLFMILIFVIFPTQGINQRFWTAGMIFLFGAYKSILKDDKFLGYFFVLAAPLMHIGVVFFTIGFFLFILTRMVHPYILVLLLPASFFLSNNFATIFEPTANLVGGALAEKFSNYTGAFGEQLLKDFSERTWYASYWRHMAVFSLFSLFLYALNRVIHSSDYKLKAVFRFTLSVFLISTLLSSFSMSFRYEEFMIFLLAAALYLFVQRYKIDEVYKILTVLVSPGIMLLLAIKLSALLQFLTPYFFISNIMTAWFFEDADAVWEFLDFLNV